MAQELPLGAIAHQLRLLVSNAAGLLELLFLVLVFVIYLLLARQPGACLEPRAALLGSGVQWISFVRRL